MTFQGLEIILLFYQVFPDIPDVVGTLATYGGAHIRKI